MCCSPTHPRAPSPSAGPTRQCIASTKPLPTPCMPPRLHPPPSAHAVAIHRPTTKVHPRAALVLLHHLLPLLFSTVSQGSSRARAPLPLSATKTYSPSRPRRRSPATLIRVLPCPQALLHFPSSNFGWHPQDRRRRLLFPNHGRSAAATNTLRLVPLRSNPRTRSSASAPPSVPDRRLEFSIP